VETSVGEPLISKRPLAVTLVSNESTRLWGPKPSYTKICCSITLHSPVVVSLPSSTQKTLGLQTPSVPNISGRLNNVQECPVGSATGGQWAVTGLWILHFFLVFSVHSIFPSVTFYRKQFLRKTWRIQLAFLRFILSRMFFFSLTLCNTSSFFAW